MNQKQFQFQIERLKSVYGDKHYSDERVELLSSAFMHENYAVFKTAISDLIMEEKYPPMKSKISEFVILSRKAMPEAPKPVGCVRCNHTGRILKDSKKYGEAPLVYACTCQLGKVYQSSHKMVSNF